MFPKSKIAMAVLFLFGLLLRPAAALEEEKRPVLIDTDMACDDVRALFALLGDDHLSILAILSVEGSCTLGKATEHIAGLIESTDVEGIPIYRGAAAPLLKKPDWRDRADGLGGAPFPRPAEVQPFPNVTQKLNELLLEKDRTVQYLALGPLGNLARLSAKFQGALERLDTLWIPVRKQGEAFLESWNLTWDRPSAEEVLPKARRVVFVDVAAFSDVDAGGFLRSIEGDEPAAQWIRRSTAAESRHLFLFDELAAAALLKPDLLDFGGERFRLKTVGKDGVELAPSPEGNMVFASFKDKAQALEVLKTHWEGRLDLHHVSELEVSLNLKPRDLLKLYHGHLGPYVALGYRMGKAALKKADAEGHFDVSAKIFVHLEPPPSCLIDGVQISTGCTLGKRNIEVEETDGPPYGVITTTRGKAVTVRVRPEIPPLIAKKIEEDGLEAAADFLLEADAETLFEVEMAFIPQAH